jgi:prevent-host-death family protein
MRDRPEDFDPLPTDIGASDLRANLGDILQQVHQRGRVFYVTIHGRPVAVITPMPLGAPAEGPD